MPSLAAVTGRHEAVLCITSQVKYFCNEAFELGLYGKAIDAYQV